MLQTSLVAVFLYITISSVTCLPFFLTSVFGNGSCTSPIHQELDIEQGLYPDLNTSKKFGYIYRLDTPNLRLGPDMDVQFVTKDSISQYLPSQAAVVLSRLSYDNGKIIIQGRISKLNADRIQRTNNMEGSIMTFKFDTFSSPHGQKSLSSKGFITGQVKHLKVVFQKHKEEDLQELIMELVPLTEGEGEGKQEQLEYISINGGIKPKQINWSVKRGCEKRKRLNSKRNKFHEIIESAVLL